MTYARPMMPLPAKSHFPDTANLQKAECLQSLRKVDENIEDVIEKATFASVYKLDVQRKVEWDRHNCEGFLYVVKRKCPPTHRLIVLNQKNQDNLIEDITTHWEISGQENYIFYRISPGQSTSQRQQGSDTGTSSSEDDEARDSVSEGKGMKQSKAQHGVDGVLPASGRNESRVDGDTERSESNEGPRPCWGLWFHNDKERVAIQGTIERLAGLKPTVGKDDMGPMRRGLGGRTITQIEGSAGAGVVSGDGNDGKGPGIHPNAHPKALMRNGAHDPSSQSSSSTELTDDDDDEEGTASDVQSPSPNQHGSQPKLRDQPSRTPHSSLSLLSPVVPGAQHLGVASEDELIGGGANGGTGSTVASGQQPNHEARRHILGMLNHPGARFPPVAPQPQPPPPSSSPTRAGSVEQLTPSSGDRSAQLAGESRSDKELSHRHQLPLNDPTQSLSDAISPDTTLQSRRTATGGVSAGHGRDMLMASASSQREDHGESFVGPRQREESGLFPAKRSATPPTPLGHGTMRSRRADEVAPRGISLTAKGGGGEIAGGGGAGGGGGMDTGGVGGQNNHTGNETSSWGRGRVTGVVEEVSKANGCVQPGMGPGQKKLLVRPTNYERKDDEGDRRQPASLIGAALNSIRDANLKAQSPPYPKQTQDRYQQRQGTGVEGSGEYGYANRSREGGGEVRDRQVPTDRRGDEHEYQGPESTDVSRIKDQLRRMGLDAVNDDGQTRRSSMLVLNLMGFGASGRGDISTRPTLTEEASQQQWSSSGVPVQAASARGADPHARVGESRGMGGVAERGRPQSSEFYGGDDRGEAMRARQGGQPHYGVSDVGRRDRRVTADDTGREQYSPSLEKMGSQGEIRQGTRSPQSDIIGQMMPGGPPGVIHRDASRGTMTDVKGIKDHEQGRHHTSQLPSWVEREGRDGYRHVGQRGASHPQAEPSYLPHRHLPHPGMSDEFFHSQHNHTHDRPSYRRPQSPADPSNRGGDSGEWASQAQKAGRDAPWGVSNATRGDSDMPVTLIRGDVEDYGRSPTSTSGRAWISRNELPALFASAFGGGVSSSSPAKRLAHSSGGGGGMGVSSGRQPGTNLAGAEGDAVSSTGMRAKTVGRSGPLPQGGWISDGEGGAQSPMSQTQHSCGPYRDYRGQLSQNHDRSDRQPVEERRRESEAAWKFEHQSRGEWERERGQINELKGELVDYAYLSVPVGGRKSTPLPTDPSRQTIADQQMSHDLLDHSNHHAPRYRYSDFHEDNKRPMRYRRQERERYRAGDGDSSAPVLMGPDGYQAYGDRGRVVQREIVAGPSLKEGLPHYDGSDNRLPTPTMSPASAAATRWLKGMLGFVHEAAAGGVPFGVEDDEELDSPDIGVPRTGEDMPRYSRRSDGQQQQPPNGRHEGHMSRVDDRQQGIAQGYGMSLHRRRPSISQPVDPQLSRLGVPTDKYEEHLFRPTMMREHSAGTQQRRVYQFRFRHYSHSSRRGQGGPGEGNQSQSQIGGVEVDGEVRGEVTGESPQSCPFDDKGMSGMGERTKGSDHHFQSSNVPPQLKRQMGQHAPQWAEPHQGRHSQGYEPVSLSHSRGQNWESSRQKPIEDDLSEVKRLQPVPVSSYSPPASNHPVTSAGSSPLAEGHVEPINEARPLQQRVALPTRRRRQISQSEKERLWVMGSTFKQVVAEVFRSDEFIDLVMTRLKRVNDQETLPPHQDALPPHQQQSSSIPTTLRAYQTRNPQQGSAVSHNEYPAFLSAPASHLTYPKGSPPQQPHPSPSHVEARPQYHPSPPHHHPNGGRCIQPDPLSPHSDQHYHLPHQRGE
eukprot:GHVN01074160.1.p1 GENE.GHVN01074160.1~~GHVN01074160.1.p1  ORF type:complete len:1798 (-),score=384.12 GHVN01074160.1:2214-7607(-)